MAGSIKLSKKHGLNLSLSVCMFCGGEKNEVVIPGKLKDDAEAPRRAVWNSEPCATCAEYMEKGVMLISVRYGSDPDNPYRTGRIVVLKDEAVRTLFPDSKTLIESRAGYLEESIFVKIFGDEHAPDKNPKEGQST